MNLLELIKCAGREAVYAENPIAVMFGTVKQLNPLAIEIDPRLILPADFFVLTESVSGKLQTGDFVLILRMHGGQSYVIVDKVKL